MAVLLETSKGDLVVDLLPEEAPLAARSFLKLCKAKYFNNCLFHTVRRGVLVQTGDPTNTGRGGSSVYGLLDGPGARFFRDEIHPRRKHTAVGVVGMASAGEHRNGSQFYITTGKDLDALDGQHTIFGEVTEGLEALGRIDEAFCDDKGRPWQNIRIRHTIVLDDPFEDPPGLAALIPAASPVLERDQEDDRLEDDWEFKEDTRPREVVEEEARTKEAKSRAVVLEMIGDMPDAEAEPEKNMIFICKLNPVTTEEDLEIIFSRFGQVTSCDIVKDWKTGDSLCYGFVGFETNASAEAAYFKMNNCLIDDRRVHVDFYRSMYHQWKAFSKKGTRPPRAEQQLPDAGQVHASSRHLKGGGRPGPPPGPPPPRRPDGDCRDGPETGGYHGQRGDRYRDDRYRDDRHRDDRRREDRRRDDRRREDRRRDDRHDREDRGGSPEHRRRRKHKHKHRERHRDRERSRERDRHRR